VPRVATLPLTRQSVLGNRAASTPAPDRQHKHLTLRRPHIKGACEEEEEAVNVRFGSLADISVRPRHVRFTPNSGHEIAIRDLRSLSVRFGAKYVPFTPNSGHSAVRLECPLRANSGQSETDLHLKLKTTIAI
jgi:hypothetical protein